MRQDITVGGRWTVFHKILYSCYPSMLDNSNVL